MRADVKKLFTGIIEKLNIKLSILQDILERESDKRYLITADSVPALLNAIEDDKHTFEAMDVLDFEISELKSRICEIAGIPPQGFNGHITKSKAHLATEYNELIAQIDNVLKNLHAERNKLIKEMEEKIVDIGFDIESLRRIMKLKQS